MALAACRVCAPLRHSVQLIVVYYVVISQTVLHDQDDYI